MRLPAPGSRSHAKPAPSHAPAPPWPPVAPEPERSARPARAWLILAFWLAVIGSLYLLMNQLLQPPKAQTIVLHNGVKELQLPRHRDGHYYIDGRLNGAPLKFMVDTGASIVSVSEATAQAAGLQGGEERTFRTANGLRQARVVTAQSLELAELVELRNIKIATGLNMGSASNALLGQNVLSQFNIRIEDDVMVLTPR